MTPKASKNAIGKVVADGQGYGVLKVAVTAIPEKGGANASVIGMLAKAWGLRKTDMTISRGQTDRNKTILIAGADKEMRQGLETLVGIAPEGKDRDD